MCSIQANQTFDAVIQTERLRLRPVRKSDAGRIASLADDFDLARMTVRIPHPYRDEDAQGFIARMGEPGRFAIEHGEDGLVGVLGFHDVDAKGAPELGYWLGRPYWGRGLATEAVSAALAWAKQGWGRKVVHAGHFADNDASAQVLIKSDFLYTGDVQRTHSKARGGSVEVRRMVWLA